MRVENSGAYGDIKRYLVKIDGKDVTSAVPSVKIYQNIFLPCWSAVIHVEDSANLMMNIPIRPGSEIEFTIETDVNSVLDGEKTYNFIVYKLGNKILMGQMHQRYDLYCATKGFLTNQTVRIQKTYSNMKPEAAVENICSEFLEGQLEKSDASDVNYHTIVPNWSPYVACWWYAKLALLENRSDYVFFMKDFDKYWFTSIEKMYTGEDSGVTFKQKPSNFRNDAGDFEDDYCIMINKYHNTHYDSMSNLGTGYYRSKLLSYDVINKKWESKVFTFGDDLPADKEMKPWDIYDQAENANVSFLPKHPGLHANPTIDDQVTNWHVSRKSRLMVLEQNKLQVQHPGGAKAWELLGQKCKVELPSHQDQVDEKLDKYFKGDYLVSHVVHDINAQVYTCNLELLKCRLEEKMTKGEE